MGMLLGCFISGIAGILFYRLIINNRILNAIDYISAFVIGLYLSACVVLISFFIFNQYSPMGIFLLMCLFIFTLSFMNLRRNSLILPCIRINCFSIGLILLFILFLLIAFLKPFGDWDAWALWNFRANYLVRSSYYWADIFSFNLHGHPPWFLSLLVVWGWTISLGETIVVPVAISAIGALLLFSGFYYGLRLKFDCKSASFIGLILLTTPFFFNHMFSQYADLWGAICILLSAIHLIQASKSQERSRYVVSGMFLSLAIFTKNDVMVIACIYLILLILFMKTSISNKSAFLKGLLSFLIFTFIPAWLMKGDLSGVNDIDFSLLLKSERWFNILVIIMQHMFDIRNWGITWCVIIPFSLYLLHTRCEFIHKITLIMVILSFLFFYILYIIVVHHYQWRVEVSIDRLLFILTPLIIFTLSYAIFDKKYDK